MKDSRRKLMLLQPFDYEGIEAWLEKMAAEGWQLESTGAYLWKFRRSEPAKTHYSLVFMPKTSAYDPKKENKALDLEAYCSESGWKLVCSSGKVHIFRNDEEDPIPIETDERIKLNNVRRSMLISYLLPLMIITAGMVMLNGGIIGFWTNPARSLSSYSGMVGAAMTTCVFFLTIVCTGTFLHWYRASKRAVDGGGSCAPTGLCRKLYYISLVMIIVAMVFSILTWSAEDMGHAFAIVIYMVMVFILGAVGWMIREKFAYSGMSTKMNRILTNVILVLLSLALTGAFIAGIIIMEVELDNDEKSERSKSMMPLTSEDLRDIGDEPYSYDWESTETFVLGRDQAFQESTAYMEEEYSEDSPEYDLNYTIVHVKENRLYQRCLRDMMSDELFWFTDMISNNETTWKQIEPPAKASKAYRRSWDDEYVDELILCYPDRIVMVTPYFDDELSEDDIRVIDEKLGSL